jgi:hypothetical protein
VTRLQLGLQQPFFNQQALITPQTQQQSSTMGWFTDFFHNQMQQGVEDIATDAKAFEGRLDDAMDKQEAQ